MTKESQILELHNNIESELSNDEYSSTMGKSDSIDTGDVETSTQTRPRKSCDTNGRNEFSFLLLVELSCLSSKDATTSDEVRSQSRGE
jgi:hypothetical protein